MTPLDRPEPVQQAQDNLTKRKFLCHLAATSIAVILWPSGAEAVMELWEAGDPLCVVPYRSTAEA